MHMLTRHQAALLGNRTGGNVAAVRNSPKFCHSATNLQKLELDEDGRMPVDKVLAVIPWNDLLPGMIVYLNIREKFALARSCHYFRRLMMNDLRNWKNERILSLDPQGMIATARFCRKLFFTNRSFLLAIRNVLQMCQPHLDTLMVDREQVLEGRSSSSTFPKVYPKMIKTILRHNPLPQIRTLVIELFGGTVKNGTLVFCPILIRNNK